MLFNWLPRISSRMILPRGSAGAVALALASVAAAAAAASKAAGRSVRPTSLWNASAAPNGTKSDPSLSADGNTVFIGLNSGAVIALSTASGAAIWRYQTMGQVFAGVVPAPRGDRVYVGSGDGSEYCLDSGTGEMVWQFATKGPVYVLL